jgi:hypothetical protein
MNACELWRIGSPFGAAMLLSSHPIIQQRHKRILHAYLVEKRLIREIYDMGVSRTTLYRILTLYKAPRREIQRRKSRNT